MKRWPTTNGYAQTETPTASDKGKSYCTVCYEESATTVVVYYHGDNNKPYFRKNTCAKCLDKIITSDREEMKHEAKVAAMKESAIATAAKRKEQDEDDLLAVEFAGNLLEKCGDSCRREYVLGKIRQLIDTPTPAVKFAVLEIDADTPELAEVA